MKTKIFRPIALGILVSLGLATGLGTSVQASLVSNVAVVGEVVSFDKTTVKIKQGSGALVSVPRASIVSPPELRPGQNATALVPPRKFLSLRTEKDAEEQARQERLKHRKSK